MIEDIFYQDKGQVKITAASVGIGSLRWICIRSSDIKEDNYKSTMRENRFDILPIISTDNNIYEYFKTSEPNNFTDINKFQISFSDTISLETPIREVIKAFVVENRNFYFLLYQNRITGLITLGNLNCRQVQVYIFNLICELERKISEFIIYNIENKVLRNYIFKKSHNNEKLQKVLEHYDTLVELDLENNLIEHLYLSDFFNIVSDFELHSKLDLTKPEWKDLSSINNLRHQIAHPTRSLLDNENTVERLWKRINKAEDLIFRIDQFNLR